MCVAWVGGSGWCLEVTAARADNLAVRGGGRCGGAVCCGRQLAGPSGDAIAARLPDGAGSAVHGYDQRGGGGRGTRYLVAYGVVVAGVGTGYRICHSQARGTSRCRRRGACAAAGSVV